MIDSLRSFTRRERGSDHDPGELQDHSWTQP